MLDVINQGELADLRLHTTDGPMEIHDVTYANIDPEKQEVAIVGDRIVCSSDIKMELSAIRAEIDRENANMVFHNEYLGADGIVYEDFGHEQDDIDFVGFGDR